MKRKAKQAPTLTVRNYSWGCIYTGTKAALVAAGLATAADFPKGKQETGAEYYLPTVAAHAARISNWRYATGKPGVFEVWVNYGAADLECSHRVMAAMEEIGRIAARLANLVQSIPPRPLSSIIGVKAEVCPVIDPTK